MDCAKRLNCADVLFNSLVLLGSSVLCLTVITISSRDVKTPEFRFGRIFVSNGAF